MADRTGSFWLARWRSISAVLLITLLLAGGVCVAGTPEEAGRVAQKYMLAMLQGDFDALAKLTHPDVFSNLKKLFFSEFDRTKDERQQSELLIAMGFRSRAEAANAKPEVFYLAVLKGNRASAEYYAAMQRAVVDILSADADGKGKAKVRFSVSTPSGSKMLDQQATFYLRETSDGWKVLGDNSPK